MSHVKNLFFLRNNLSDLKASLKKFATDTYNLSLQCNLKL